MHGRQKVQQSAEEEAKKQTERRSKVAAYKFAMSKIFEKRVNREFGLDLLELTGKVLASNPDIATLWNIRREVLLNNRNTNPEKFTEQVISELELTEIGLRQNPKSYGAWYHRYWLMKETNFELIESELKLCAKYLQYDDRNFHCWDYRRFLTEHNPKITIEEEIKFTTEKIKNNFSNYSSWHLRSKLLPRVTPDILAAELELIQNAAFTDPNDQSVWFYHKWLVNTQLQNVDRRLTYIGHVGDEIYLVFNADVPNPLSLAITVSAVSKSEEVTVINSTWENPWKKPKCKVWVTKLSLAEAAARFLLTFSGEVKIPKEFAVDDALRCFTLEKHQIISQEFVKGQESSDIAPFLEKELSWVEELHELEPENKWAILTMIHLLRLVNFRGNEEKVWGLIERLKVLDSKRTKYYEDLRKNFQLERSVLNSLNVDPALCSYILPPL